MIIVIIGVYGESIWDLAPGMIAIIDYNAGNLRSVQCAINTLGVASEITSDPSLLRDAERIIFPGVGAAGKAMSELKALGFDRALWEAFEEGKPILGICLGCQIIMEHSEENNTQCLGMVKGKVKRFDEQLHDDNGLMLKVPHMGWNGVRLERDHPLFQGISPENEFYFVHSYYPCPSKERYVLGKTDYGVSFASVIEARNLVAVQFHVEKSGKPGLNLLSNFCRWNGEGCA